MGDFHGKLDSALHEAALVVCAHDMDADGGLFSGIDGHLQRHFESCGTGLLQRPETHESEGFLDWATEVCFTARN